MKPTRSALLALAVLSVGAGCGAILGIDDRVVDDGGVDGSIDVAHDTTVDVALDVALDVAHDAAVCDPTKAFEPPTPMLLNGAPVDVDAFGSFHFSSDRSTAWLERAGVVGEYALAGDVLTATTVPKVPSTSGFGVTGDGKTLLVSNGTSFSRWTRSAIGAPWSPAGPLPVKLDLPDGASSQAYFHPTYVGNGPEVHFGRFVNASPQSWDIARADENDAAVLLQAELHVVPGFVAFPTFATERTMYFAAWGSGLAYPRLARTTRATATSPWASPQMIATLGVGDADTVEPLAVSPDECTVWVAVSRSIDGGFSLAGPFTLMVARRAP